MADRYWVGGTAAWDGTAGTKWATTSGGAGGAAIPTSADDVFFDAASGANTVTISTGNTGAKSINCTGFTGTLAGSAAITVSGSVTLVAGMTFTFTGITTINGTATITSAGKTLPRLVISGAGIVVDQADAFNLGGQQLNLVQGTYNTNNYSLSCNYLQSQGSSTRTLNLGSSTVTTNFSIITLFDGSNFTFNSGTSTITTNITGGASISNTGAYTFYNVSFTGTGANTLTIAGNNTFNNLTITAPSSAGVRQVTFDSRQTINGTLSTTGTAGNRRVWFRGVTYGLAQTLTVNATPSLTDADFRDLYIVGTAAPISGTRIGDLRGCSGITFSTPKTVYWNLAGAQNWSANGWSDTSTGTPSTDFFPLAQDTATFTDAGSVTGTITMDSAVPYTGTVDMSGRTSAMTLNVGLSTIYGDWKNGSGTALAGTLLTFSGRNTQVITSAGKALSQISIDSYGGTVELADALNIGSSIFGVTNGTFDTKNYNVTASRFDSSNSNVRAFRLGSSTVTLSSSAAVIFDTFTNLTVSAGTSQINCTNTGNTSFAGGNQTYYNVSFTGTAIRTLSIGAGVNTFNNLTITPPASAGYMVFVPGSGTTITGTLTVAGASPLRRIFVNSGTIGTTNTLTVGTLSATDCDFRDITIAGTAAGSSPTRAGDCGGNNGITFPAPKTVYWNLAGAQNWSATAWAPGTGGTPNINNFPLAQDTAVFDNTGSAGTVAFDVGWNVGTVDASARTTAMTLSTSTLNPFVYGDWKFGTGVTSSSTTGTITFAKRGTQTITSNGVTFGCFITINPGVSTGIVQLADALTIEAAKTLTLTTGTFDAVTFNATVGLFAAATGSTLKMGTGTWTLSGTGTVWSGGMTNLYVGTANIVLSDTSTTARTFAGGGFSYNKLTIGGTTGISTLTITGNNFFSELASTKTVAHTIALGTTVQTFGKWTVTGTSGNVVTLTGTGASHVLAGACTDSIDYLAMGSIGFAATSPGEFYAGANSTATSAVAPVYLTAKPADSTRYWVGGTGNWSDTAMWSTMSGGPGGADLPRSTDDIIFDSLSNATTYTTTLNTAAIRCKKLTMNGPASGNVEFLISVSSNLLIAHDDVFIAATGVINPVVGTQPGIVFSGSSTGKTITTNNFVFISATINGYNSSWSLATQIITRVAPGSFNVTLGTFTTNNNSVSTQDFNSSSNTTRTINLGSSTINCTTFNLGSSETSKATLTFNAGTSSIVMNGGSGGVSSAINLSGNNQTFYNVSSQTTALSNPGSSTINGNNIFNNLTFIPNGTNGYRPITFNADQTINGTLTASGTILKRQLFNSNVVGTSRTLTCNAVNLADVDFRDIIITGAAAPVTGTRLGNAKGNSGITFSSKTVYWNLAGAQNWEATGWATSSGGTPNINNFPLPQDTAVFDNTGSVTGTITLGGWYVGTIDMSARTSAMTLSTTTPTIIGNWINGSGTTLAGTGAITFSGRGTQQITSAGKTWTQLLTIDSLGGSVVLQDALTASQSSASVLTLTNGTFNASTYNVTLSGAASGVASSNSNTRTIAVGSGTWTIAGTTGWNAATSTGLSITGSGTISMTSASAKTFAGGGISYGSVVLNQGGAGALTITGNNTFKDITNTYKATGATSITMGTTTQRVSQFTAAGEATRLLTIQGTSASSPATLVYTGGSTVSSDYLTITGVRAYPLTSTWSAGANSTNNGSLGWDFTAAPVAVSSYRFFFFF